MLYARQREEPLDKLSALASREDLLGDAGGRPQNVEVKPRVGALPAPVVAATREHKDVVLGVSPRGALALFRAAQARAFSAGAPT